MNLIFANNDTLEVEALLYPNPERISGNQGQFQDYDGASLYSWWSGRAISRFILNLDQFEIDSSTAQPTWTPSSVSHALWRWESYWFALCPKRSISKWVNAWGWFQSLQKDDKEFVWLLHFPGPKRYWTAPPTEKFAASAMNFGGYQLILSRPFERNQLIYATDHLYGICQQNFSKMLNGRWQTIRGSWHRKELQFTSSSTFQLSKKRFSAFTWFI